MRGDSMQLLVNDGQESIGCAALTGPQVGEKTRDVLLKWRVHR
jgi:hypothetical protein